MKDNILTVLDVGSSKVASLMGRMLNDGSIDIIGMGVAPCKGIEQGTVVDIKATEDAIQQAVSEVRATAGINITSVYLGTGGIHIAGRTSHGSTAIRGKEVEMEDVETVVGAAKAVVFPQDELLIHALPQSFSIDGQHNVRRPLGMSGVRLEVNSYLISGLGNIVRNLHKCVARCNLSVERVVVEQVADSYCALQQDEREAGVCLINIGAGTVKTLVIKDSAPLFISTLPTGGDNVTNDIAAALRIPTRLAEDYKKRYGCALADRTKAEDVVKISRVDYRSEQEVSRQTLASFIQPRYEEMLSFVEEQLIKEELKRKITAGVVLVGGASRIEGLSDLAAEIMHSAVRVGSPLNISNASASNSTTVATSANQMIKDNPAFTTACGMLEFGLEERIQARHSDGFFYNHNPFGRSAWFDRIHNWVGKNFSYMTI